LQKLLDQMADAQSLQASLDAPSAQWAIANSKVGANARAIPTLQQLWLRPMQGKGAMA
jgi:hypothetical protein